MDDLHYYFYHRVKEPYERYLHVKGTATYGGLRDIAAAMEAAKALYHLREHIPQAYAKSWRDIAAQCPDYALLRDVVDADKHGRLADQTRAVCDASQIGEYIVVTEYEDEHGTYGHAEKAVWLHLTDGSERDILDVLTNVMNFWLDELHALGVTGKAPHYSASTGVRPRPRKECNYGYMDMELVAGLGFKPKFALQWYNYSCGQVEPVNLAGVPLEFSVYKRPPSEVTISYTNKTTAQVLTRKVTVEGDLDRVRMMATNRERQDYLMSLPSVRSAYEELVEEVKRFGQGGHHSSGIPGHPDVGKA
jgi:hypothetical protein